MDVKENEQSDALSAAVTETATTAMADKDENSGETGNTFYNVSKSYWSKQPATVDGMLGGYEFVSDPDVQQSQIFLNNFINTRKEPAASNGKVALDCGAGIGRVTKHLLLNNFEFVEMVDVTENFRDAATSYLGAEAARRVLKFHCCGLQSFYPEPGRYDCVWIQWVIGYLTDADAVDFLRRCKLALRAGGVCVLKENVCIGERELDEVDSSYTRSRQTYLNLIHKAGLHLLRDERQRKFPAELYEVRMFAFK